MNDVNPRIDIAFNKLFGSEENIDLLKSFINSIVSVEDQVSELSLLNPYNYRQFIRDKLSVLDIKAIGKTGKLYSIGMQLGDEADYNKRALYYWKKLYNSQLLKGSDYGSRHKSIGIHVLNFDSLPGEKCHNVFLLKEKETNTYIFKDLEIHTIELSKFHCLDKTAVRQKQLEDLLKKVKSTSDQWIAFLAHYDLFTQGVKLPFKLVANPYIKEAFRVLEIMSLDEVEREFYEAQRNWILMKNSCNKKSFLNGKEEGLIEGKKEGLIEGKKEGLIEGKKEGILQGRMNEKKNTVHKLLEQNVSLSLICTVTGFSVENINKMRKQKKASEALSDKEL